MNGAELGRMEGMSPGTEMQYNPNPGLQYSCNALPLSDPFQNWINTQLSCIPNNGQLFEMLDVEKNQFQYPDCSMGEMKSDCSYEAQRHLKNYIPPVYNPLPESYIYPSACSGPTGYEGVEDRLPSCSKQPIWPQSFDYFPETRLDSLEEKADFGPDYQFSRLTNIDLSNVLNDGVYDDNLKGHTITSDEDESDIIVEDSDDESEISISEVGGFVNPLNAGVELSCVVCGTLSSDTSVSHFVHLSQSFPLTFASQTPVINKLMEFVPYQVQSYVKLCDTAVCRRCLSLVDNVESLETKLSQLKKTLYDCLARFSSLLDGHVITDETNNIVQVNEPAEVPILLDKAEPIEPSPPIVLEEKQVKEVKETFFLCDWCGKGLHDKKSLQRHLDQHNKNSRFQCEKCGKIYSKKYKLSDHLLKHLGKFRSKCEHCGKGFMRQYSLQIHLRCHKELRPHTCEKCGDSFVTPSNLKEHTKSCKKSRCTDCKKSFTGVHDCGLRKHICVVCDKRFKHASDLSTHMLVHSEEKKFGCETCGRSYKSLSHLNCHLKTHDKSLLGCDNCDRKFATETQLEEHKTSAHFGVVGFKCDKCDKVFAKKRYLKDHAKVHTGANLIHTCPICNKSFSHGLKVHMRVHTQEKPFQCDICNISFSVKSSLNKHNKLKHSLDKGS